MDIFGIDRTIEGTVFRILFCCFGWLIWIPVGAYVASQKRRSRVEGMLMGILGPLGVIVEALLPTQWENDHHPSF